MDTPHTTRLVELALSHRYTQAHGWVVNAVTGWLSAYYMEDPRFRVSRRCEDLETGVHLWVCEFEEGFSMPRLLKRLQADIPSYVVHESHAQSDGSLRYVIDLAEIS
ncbi:MAG TPA: hypothetical protein VJ692_04690 [Nitrospiraceae bacterium]|nr:hypothetical protein [Nitrospiraceae bacterium]